MANHELDCIDGTFGHDSDMSYWWKCPHCNTKNDVDDCELPSGESVEDVECSGCEREYQITVYGDYYWSPIDVTLKEKSDA